MWIDNDVNTIAKTLKEAVALPEEKYQQMGVRGRELIKENYSIEIMKQLYQWILGQAGNLMCCMVYMREIQFYDFSKSRIFPKSHFRLS
jgi:hypothetical protein